MNTATELRKFTENQAMEKATQAVTDALANAPFGLEISQIMNNCRLSNKTTKAVLHLIKAVNNNGVWSSAQSDETKIQIFNVRPTAIKKVEAMVAPAQKISEPQVKYLTRLINLFKANTKGISLANALLVLGGERKRFDQELIRVRRYHFPVRLETVDGQRLYIPDLNKKPEFIKTSSVKDKTEKINITVSDNKPKPAITAAAPNIPLNQEIQDKVFEFRGMVQRRTVITEEVVLNSDQLDNVLKNIFGLDTVTWSNDSGKVQVHLTKTEVA